MAYVGTPLDTTNAFQSLAGKRFSGDASTTDFTLDSSPNSTLDIEVFVDNVRQDPNSAYTLSGTTLAFTAAPPTGTNNIYVVHQAKAVGTINPADGTITADKMAEGTGGFLDWQSVVTSNTTMVAGRGYFVNTSGGAITMTLPASATIGDTVAIIDYGATADTNNITVGRNSHNIQGSGANLTVSTERAAFELIYVDSTQGWLLNQK